MQDAAALLCLLFIGLQLIDYELTSGILKRGGRELNPMLRWLMGRIGTRPALLAAQLLAVALGWLLAYHGEALALVALCVIYTGVCAWNWRVLRRLRRASSTVG